MYDQVTKQRVQLGRWGEERAEEYLKRLGYRIVHRNYRGNMGEIDLIAEHKGTLCFIEVRTRTSDWQGHPLESVTDYKKRRLTLTAMRYLEEFSVSDQEIRFDVVGVIPREHNQFDVELIQDAFEAAIS